MLQSYAKQMKMGGTIRIAPTLLALAFAGGLSLPAHGQSFGKNDEQDAARRAMLDGQVMPFSVIKRKVDREVGEATYLGSEFDARRKSYRLKYVREGKVVWVDVDGRTGDIIGWAR